MKKILLTIAIVANFSIAGNVFAACTAPVNMNTQKIVNLAAGTATTDAATFEQVVDVLKKYSPI